MRLPSPPRGSREGRSRGPQDSFSLLSGTDRAALRKFRTSLESVSSPDFPSRLCTAAPGLGASQGRSGESPPERVSTKKKAEAEKKDKRKRSKKSRKKKHRKKRRRRSTSSSSSSSSSSSRSSSRSRSRSPPQPPSRTDQFRPRPPTTACPSSSSSFSSSAGCQAGPLHNQRTSGWDVGPVLLADKREAVQEKRETRQQHDPRTYEKAFGVAIPSGQYGFVSEETDLAQFLPHAKTGQATTSPAAVGALSTAPARTAAAAGEGSESPSAGNFLAAPPALGVLRLLKEANETQKGRQAGTCESTAEESKKGSARGGAKVTSKTHPHLFWQCWNCNADNYKTRHQCYRCNRLYMQ